MKSKQETFASLIESFRYHFDIHTVFDDFLTLAIAACGQNPVTKLSYDEELYLQTIAKYKHHDLRLHFPKMFTALTNEMEERMGSHTGNDVLGDYYEQSLAKKGSGQFFTPWPICVFMASILIDSERQEDAPLRVIDPTCGSGRTLLAAKKKLGWEHHYYGIDIDYTCAKMAALNLFLNGSFRSEVMCADALTPDDFRVSYRTSFLPFGIFRITEKEHSPLWHSYNASFKRKEIKVQIPDITLPSEDGSSISFDKGNSQLTLF